MKHLLTIILLLLSLSCCTSEGEMTRMREGLDSLNQRNRNDQPFTVADVEPYVQFFDDHGTPNDRMLAHYLLGRVYHIRGESPQALLEYNKAISSVDTTDGYVDLKQLSRVYGQMATVYHQQKALLLELSAQKEAERIALKGKDTLSAVLFHLNLSRAYYMLDMTDSALMICL